MKKMEVLWEKMEVLEEEEANKTMKKHVMWGKTKKFFLNKTLFVQNTRFLWLEWVANKSLSQVAKNTWQKFWKNLTKCFSRLGSSFTRKSRRELRIILSKLVTGASTREPVAKLNCKNAKNLEILKIFQVFFTIGG